MSLNTVTGALGGRVSQDKTVKSLSKGEAPSLVRDTTQRLGETTKGVTGVHLPGEFPTDDGRKDKGRQTDDVSVPSFSAMFASLWDWVKSFVPSAVELFESSVKRLILWLLPPSRQAAIYEAAMSHPIAGTFIFCQLLCCGVPILIFLAGTFLFAAVAILLWAVLSLLILGPMMLVAAVMGVGLWGWGWVLYALVKWTDLLLLNGMLSRVWFPGTKQADGEEPEKSEAEKEKEKEK